MKASNWFWIYCNYYLSSDYLGNKLFKEFINVELVFLFDVDYCDVEFLVVVDDGYYVELVDVEEVLAV